MTDGWRTALLVTGITLGIGGLGYGLVEVGVLPNPFGPKPPAGLTAFPIKWPQTFYQAQQALIQLSVIAIENKYTTLETQAHAEAQAIRSVYAGSGPAGGYTCQQLVAMGKIDPKYCTTAG